MAEENLNTGLKITEEVNDNAAKDYLKEILGKLNLKQNKYKEAIDYYNGALELFKLAGYLNSVNSIRKTIYEIKKKKK